MKAAQGTHRSPGDLTGRTLVLVAHGTRNPRGVEIVAKVAEAVAEKVGPTRVAFVDVLGPSPSEALRQVPGPAVVVPAFLASGYHVRVDVPTEVEASRHNDVLVTAALGPDPILAEILHERLREAGWRPGDAVVMAAAGSSDDRALGDVGEAADMLSTLIGAPVAVGYVATAQPRIADVVEKVRRDTGRRVFIATYLLAEGLFHTKLLAAGADGVADPIGVHPRLVDLVCARMGIQDAQSTTAMSMRSRFSRTAPRQWPINLRPSSLRSSRIAKFVYSSK
ncbi:sirohydrochlorin chelatase [Hoyosella rhizosphaerae]|uniref:Cobalamin biosynthesis protein CbiX n=1 Tax=Hoyosella rhizosphaerae TaxID=1755582 RepID=A0A916XES9_9ACTN|nr:sirohydrochlorin chelatase [Hoyosella rhizosphaerae]MBN4925959.1 sirohydrochlorin chelatase [Hoyosella rhizosphaerae]GGC66624.1 hypothetical protein GCM10011410_19060 [Hoyosella rhizosphaerae]